MCDVREWMGGFTSGVLVRAGACEEVTLELGSPDKRKGPWESVRESTRWRELQMQRPCGGNVLGLRGRVK